MGCDPFDGPEAGLQTERDAGVRAGLTTDERVRLKELERENRDLRRANEIQRKASAYFVQGGCVGAALALTRLLSSQLYGVTRTDTVIFALAAGGLVALVLLASYVPSRRAARVDPRVTLLHR